MAKSLNGGCLIIPRVMFNVVWVLEFAMDTHWLSIQAYTHLPNGGGKKKLVLVIEHWF